jgi:acyl carrier protein
MQNQTPDLLNGPGSSSCSQTASRDWTLKAVRDTLIETLTQIQQMGGNDIPAFTDGLTIMQELANFDSLISIEAVLILTEVYGINIPDDIFQDSVNLCPLTLVEVVNRIHSLIHSNLETTTTGKETI